ncbi:hypothetical protein NCCP2222_16470 [Sporosarcina sp. NCCP-2222]|uniref:DUF7147 family protein n=1 Tax=Sporosarcina sp. NCCP-2222 TaxID=2935073 RepID=UPI0020870EBC|nr:methylthioribose kinase [Sporosarcina sp. NCCP-2222]GKV55700.1 hypothetical protein NCCP2222_16470 [Sporosarcina sp. NCCP-2222]
MLQQRFIELGEGFSDVFELIELMNTNASRLHRTFIFSTATDKGNVISLAAAFHPAGEGHFMPIYICREGILQKGEEMPKRRLLFEQASLQNGCTPIPIDLQHSTAFAEASLYYQYIIGILRLNHLLPPLQ